MSTIYFITHPDVHIDPNLPVTDWSLSDSGTRRMHTMLNLDWVKSIQRIYCSSEKKAIDGAQVLSDYLTLPFHTVHELGENDRSSTGYLPLQEFELVADQFFAQPSLSVRGWETAHAAQSRIVKAIQQIIDTESGNRSIAIISHGAVGALLLCHLHHWSIAREHDQPGNGGGNYFSFESDTLKINHNWLAIDP